MPQEDLEIKNKQNKLYDTAQALMSSGSEQNSFGIYVGQKIEEIPSGQRDIAEKLISDVIFLAKTNNLRFDSRIETPSLSRFGGMESAYSSSDQSSPNILQSDHRRFSFPPQTRQTHPRPSSSHTQISEYYSIQRSPPTPSPSANLPLHSQSPSPSYHAQHPPKSPLYDSSQMQTSPAMDNQTVIYSEGSGRRNL